MYLSDFDRVLSGSTSMILHFTLLHNLIKPAARTKHTQTSEYEIGFDSCSYCMLHEMQLTELLPAAGLRCSILLFILCILSFHTAIFVEWLMNEQEKENNFYF